MGKKELNTTSFCKQLYLKIFFFLKLFYSPHCLLFLFFCYNRKGGWNNQYLNLSYIDNLALIVASQLMFITEPRQQFFHIFFCKVLNPLLIKLKKKEEESFMHPY